MRSLIIWAISSFVPCAQSLTPCSVIGICQRYIRISRLVVTAMVSSQMSADSQRAHVTDMAVWEHCSKTSLGVCQWWSGEAYPWRASQSSTYKLEAPRLDLQTQCRTINWCGGALPIPSGAWWCPPSWLEVCQQFLNNKGINAVNWSTGSAYLNPTEHLYDVMYCCITDYPQDNWCPDPGLGGDHPSSHQEYVVWSVLHLGRWRSYTQLSHIGSGGDIFFPLWFQI